MTEQRTITVETLAAALHLTDHGAPGPTVLVDESYRRYAAAIFAALPATPAEPLDVDPAQWLATPVVDRTPPPPRDQPYTLSEVEALRVSPFGLNYTESRLVATLTATEPPSARLWDGSNAHATERREKS